QPAVVPQHRERVPRASQAVPTRRSGRAAVLGDHAPGPTPPHDGGPGEILAELSEPIVAEFPKLCAEVRAGLIAMAFGVAFDHIVQGLPLPRRNVPPPPVPHETCRPPALAERSERARPTDLAPRPAPGRRPVIALVRAARLHYVGGGSIDEVRSRS